jgi:aminoglycoside phosphotransferase (APT) family kinase protein
VRKIGSGHKSEVFEQDDGSILKLFVPEFVSLAPVEVEISRTLQRAGVAAPRVRTVVNVDGRPGIVFDGLRAGMTLSRAVRTRPWRILGAAQQLAAVHAAVHRCRSTELPSQREKLEREIRAAAAVQEPARGAALERLAALPDGDIVCHNDVHMLNVIVDDEGCMLIDWVLATRGNPLSDVAAAILQLRFGDRGGNPVAHAALELGRAAFWRAYRRDYLRARPGGEDELARWELPMAVAFAGRREGRMQAQLQERISQLMGGEARPRPLGPRP